GGSARRGWPAGGPAGPAALAPLAGLAELAGPAGLAGPPGLAGAVGPAGTVGRSPVPAARTPSRRPRRSASSRRSVAISTSRAVTERAITRSASSVAWALYPHSDIG